MPIVNESVPLGSLLVDPAKFHSNFEPLFLLALTKGLFRKSMPVFSYPFLSPLTTRCSSQIQLAGLILVSVLRNTREGIFLDRLEEVVERIAFSFRWAAGIDRGVSVGSAAASSMSATIKIQNCGLTY